MTIVRIQQRETGLRFDVEAEQINWNLGDLQDVLTPSRNQIGSVSPASYPLLHYHLRDHMGFRGSLSRTREKLKHRPVGAETGRI